MTADKYQVNWDPRVPTLGPANSTRSVYFVELNPPAREIGIRGLNNKKHLMFVRAVIPARAALCRCQQPVRGLSKATGPL